MLKPSGLRILAVALLTISCLLSSCGKVALLGGPNLPQESGMHIWTGKGWHKIASPHFKHQGEFAWGGGTYNYPLGEAGPEEYKEPPIHFTGSTIKVCTMSMGRTYQEADLTMLYPLSVVSRDSVGDCYGCLLGDIVDVTATNFRNLSEPDKPEGGYTMVSIENVPPSSSGYYLLRFIADPPGIWLNNYSCVILKAD